MVKFQHTELLMDGELYLEPLRTAKVSAVYTCTDGAQEYSPGSRTWDSGTWGSRASRPGTWS